MYINSNDSCINSFNINIINKNIIPFNNVLYFSYYNQLQLKLNN